MTWLENNRPINITRKGDRFKLIINITRSEVRNCNIIFILCKFVVIIIYRKIYYSNSRSDATELIQSIYSYMYVYIYTVLNFQTNGLLNFYINDFIPNRKRFNTYNNVLKMIVINFQECTVVYALDSVYLLVRARVRSTNRSPLERRRFHRWVMGAVT